MSATLGCSATPYEDHLVARRQQASGYYGNWADVESRQSWCPGSSGKAPGGLHGLCPAPAMQVALDFQLWGLSSRFWVPSGRGSVTRPGRGTMLEGYPQCCPREPRTLVEAVAPNCFPQTGHSHACSADAREELGWPRRNERKKRQDRGGAQSRAEGSRPGRNLALVTCKRGVMLAPLPQTSY